VLVTGAAGFLGVNLCQALAEAGAEVHGTVRPGGREWRLPALRRRASVHAVDLCAYPAVRELFARLQPEVVFHAAVADAYTEAGARGAVLDTVLTLANVLDSASEQGLERLVLLGSSLVYGSSSAAHTENAPLRPASSRGAVKAASSLLAQEHARRTGLALVELRIFSVYGPWEPWHRLVPSALRAALLDEVLPLTAPGLRRDYVFVGDVVDACLRAATVPAGLPNIFNIGAGQEVSNEELAAAVREVTGRPLRVAPGTFASRPTDTAHWLADPTLARDVLGWQPRHSLRAGLEATLPWMEEQLGSSSP
jgi:nucleoside-diphosphate-sugar epimerase